MSQCFRHGGECTPDAACWTDWNEVNTRLANALLQVRAYEQRILECRVSSSTEVQKILDFIEKPKGENPGMAINGCKCPCHAEIIKDGMGSPCGEGECAPCDVDTKKRDDESRIVCWLAELNRESKERCDACKHLMGPKWYSSKGYMTDNPHEAMKFKSRQECLEHCTCATYRHFHLYPTEHMFCE